MKTTKAKKGKSIVPEKQAEKKADAIWEIMKKILGYLLIAFGIVGLFLPVLQGIVMIIAGLILTGNHAIINLIKRYFRKHHRKHYHKAMKFLKKAKLKI
jgi:hypothetical protein